ncbi:hypothetical protein HMPREF0208_04137 [Citrobacter koseri]|nr:hypothetical protein HMPREF3220_02840 [Citrobacter koseri]KXB40657.1 hypothetical protein HMPREF0208_04137 [Citrobacter koseri]
MSFAGWRLLFVGPVRRPGKHSATGQCVPDGAIGHCQSHVIEPGGHFDYH